MNEYDQERRLNAIEVLKYGPVDFKTGSNEYGRIFPTDIVMLIRLGDAEEYREGGRTWLRLRDNDKRS